MDIQKLEDLVSTDSNTKEVNPMAQFSDLPAEMHLRIASKCSSKALAALCRTSRLFHERCMEKLYRKVDLGSQAAQIEGKLFYKQSNFLRTLKRHPEYARYVQDINWALVLEPREVVDNLPHLPSYSKRNPRGIWEILQLLTDVTSVRIGQGDTVGYSCAMVPQGLSLFPKATSITMSGILTDTFVHAVLPAIKARQLQHLALYRLELEAPFGATIRFLNSLTGKCTSLKSLEILVADNGIFDDPCGALGGATASTAYMEFLESVKETLFAFWFRCKDVYGHPDNPDGDVMEMTSNIHRVLNRGTWPHLRNVTTRPIVYCRAWTHYDGSDREGL